MSVSIFSVYLSLSLQHNDMAFTAYSDLASKLTEFSKDCHYEHSNRLCMDDKSRRLNVGRSNHAGNRNSGKSSTHKNHKKWFVLTIFPLPWILHSEYTIYSIAHNIIIISTPCSSEIIFSPFSPARLHSFNSTRSPRTPPPTTTCVSGLVLVHSFSVSFSSSTRQ